MSRAGFAYAQARVHARLAARITPAEWQVLESSRDLGHCLDVAARTAQARAVTRMQGTQDVHRIEAALRAEWRTQVGEVAAWLPQAWRAAVLWFAGLPLLARADAARGGAPRPAWLAGAGEPEAEGRPAAEHWLEEWAVRLPAGTDPAALCGALGPLMARYLGGAAAPVPGDLPVWLVGRIRAEAQSPVAVFAYLGLAALDLERLRGIIAARAVFSMADGAA